MVAFAAKSVTLTHRRQLRHKVGLIVSLVVIYCTVPWVKTVSKEFNVDWRETPAHENNKAKADTVHGKECQWTLLAGDSNVRELFYVLVDFETRKPDTVQVVEGQRVGVLNSTHNNSLNEEYTRTHQLQWVIPCNKRGLDRYGDKEVVIWSNSSASSDPSCHVITFMFVWHQQGVSRLEKDLSNRDYCGTQLNTTLPSSYRLPALPHLVWFSHGLWNLPNWGKHSQGLDCKTRFPHVVKALQNLNGHDQTTVIWASLFSINVHPTITNEYIAWDVECQRRMAERYNLPMYDMNAYVKPRLPESVHDGDYHLRGPTKAYLVTNVLQDAMRQAKPNRQ